MDRTQKSAVAFADVALYKGNQTGHEVTASALTDDRGQFTLKADTGNYTLLVEYLGYKSYTRQIHVTDPTAPFSIKNILLKQDVEMLKQVEVKGNVVAVQTKEDTVEYNAQAFRVAEGSVVEDLIKKLPGAQVAADGTVTVNGKQIKKILVNGKEFFSDDPQVALKNLPANIVQKVKSYDKQSDEARLTGIDDGEDEAVLDLTVKKDMTNGWMGNVQAGLGGTPFHYDVSALLNRFDDDRNISLLGNLNDLGRMGFGEKGGGPSRMGSAGDGLTTIGMGGINYIKQSDKLRYGGNVRYGYNDNDAKKKSETELFQTGGSTYTRDTTRNQRTRNDVAMDFQLEWKPDDNSTLIFHPNINYAHTTMDGTDRSHTLNSQLRETNFANSTSSTQGDNLGAGGMLRYVRKLNKKGRNLSLSAKVDYDHANSDVYNKSNTLFHLYADEDDETGTDSLSTYDRYTSNNSNSLLYRLQAAYTEPISTHHMVQLRYSFQQRQTHTRSYVYDQTDATGNGYIDSLSSKVENTYNTHDVELNLQGKYTKFRYKAGFDLEPQHTDNQTLEGLNAGRHLTQDVWNWAPNLMLRYSFNKKHTLMFRYRGNSTEPDVQYLQEIIDQSNPLNIQYGNPDLKPTFTNKLTLRYNNYLQQSQSNLSVNLNFQNAQNDLTKKVVYNNTDGSRKSYMTNVDGNWNSGANVTWNAPIGNTKFSYNSNTTGNYQHDVGYSSSETYAEAKSITKSISLGERLSGTYKADQWDVTLNGSLAYVNADNNLNDQADRNTYDYSAGVTANITLPWDIYLSTDLTYKDYDGYASGLMESEWIWNGQLSRSFLKNKAATVRIKAIDILQQQNSLKRTISSNSITDADYNTLGSYFMVYFIYKFNTIGKKMGAEDNDNNNRNNFDGGGDFGRRGDRPDRGGMGGMGGFGGPDGMGRGPRWNDDNNATTTPAADSTQTQKQDAEKVTDKEQTTTTEAKVQRKNRKSTSTQTDNQEQTEQDDERPAPPDMENGEGPMGPPPSGGPDF